MVSYTSPNILINLQPLPHLVLSFFSVFFSSIISLYSGHFYWHKNTKLSLFIFQLWNERIKVSVPVSTCSFNKRSVVHVFWEIYIHPSFLVLLHDIVVGEMFQWNRLVNIGHTHHWLARDRSDLVHLYISMCLLAVKTRGSRALTATWVSEILHYFFVRGPHIFILTGQS